MQWKAAHFIGIGGVGMSATATLLKRAGVAVTGSDEAVYEPIASVLAQEGLVCTTPYAAANIPTNADLIVVGKNAKLVPETNAEVAAAYASGKTILSFPQVLAEVSRGKENIVVAGSYGKSTSTALMAHVLEHAGKDPSYFIGAVPKTPAHSATVGGSSLFVMEGDEYPSSNTDPRSKFLLMEPAHVLLTPLAHDHFNIFPTPADYLKPFYNLVELLPATGTLVVCTEGALSQEFIATLKRPLITYGLHSGEYQAANIVWGETTSFDLVRSGTTLCRLETSQLGEHNIQNIVGVAALLLSRSAITVDELVAGVRTFKGIVRRLDRKSEKTSVPIFEGFGSSYEKAKSAIVAIKQHFPDRTLKIIFEPYTINWRRPEALPQYKTVFEGAAQVLILDPHIPSDVPLEAIAAASGAQVVTSADEAVSKIGLAQGDVVLLLSSGPMQGLIPVLCAAAEKQFPA